MKCLNIFHRSLVAQLIEHTRYKCVGPSPIEAEEFFMVGSMHRIKIDQRPN